MLDQKILDTVKMSLEKMRVPKDLIDQIEKSVPSDGQSQDDSCEKCPKCGYDMSKDASKTGTAVEVSVMKKAPSPLQAMLDRMAGK